MKPLLAGVLGLVIFSVGCSQMKRESSLDRARALEQERKLEQALQMYEQAAEEEPANNIVQYRIAQLAYQMGDYQKATQHYERLAPNGNPTVLYNLACTLALINEPEKALKYLESAVRQGFNQASLMKTDTDLKSLWQMDQFKRIVQSVNSVENNPEAQKFDFWVGEWNVYNPAGQQAGESRIEKILKGNVILENWMGNTGFTGKSFNHFHLESGKWIQYWVNQNADRTYFEGNYDPDQEAIVFFDQAKPYPTRRLTFFNLSPDSVRQFSQQSPDSGKSWTVEYDFMYVRKPGENP